MQMVHIILLGAEVQRSLRASADIADIEARMASIGETIPNDQEIADNLDRAAEMLRELGQVNLTRPAKVVVKDLISRYYEEVAIRSAKV